MIVVAILDLCVLYEFVLRARLFLLLLFLRWSFIERSDK